MLIALICLYIHLYPDASVLSLQNICPSSAVYRDLLGMALPLTANRIVLNILQSIEAVSIPQKLLLYGYDTTTALSVYGVLTGMAMPMIFFPNALTSSVAVLLLPTISENHAKGEPGSRMERHSAYRKILQSHGLSLSVRFSFSGGLDGNRIVPQ